MLLATGWFVDETYVKVTGEWSYLYRAVDQHGQVIDVLLSLRRDLGAGTAVLHPAPRAGTIPAEVTTDRAPVYPRILDELLSSALHTVEQYANNPICLWAARSGTVSVRGSLTGYHPTDFACTSHQRERRLDRPVR